MHKAFKAIKRNRGAAGLDKQSIKMFEANLDDNLLALMRDLKSGTYQPIPLRRVYIPKGKGAVRPWAFLPCGVAWHRKCSVLDRTDLWTDLIMTALTVF
ncbi:hypothetical protein NKDENANG_03471 [Candidatus Entotheonellaceae bacterium PAL068K]